MGAMRKAGVEVLVAEDSQTQAAMLSHVLEQHGYRVTVARNGREALEMIERRRPDLIISDVVMPELDGYGLCSAVKGDPRWSDIPLMLVTTLSDARDVVLGLECGADNFIRKPYDARYLLSRAEYLLMNREIRKNQKMRIGVEISLRGQRHFITAERQQMLDLLVSIYEQAVDLNAELNLREKRLVHSNRVLSALYGLADGLNRVDSMRAVAEMALEKVHDLPGVQAGWILLREEETRFRLAAARNIPPLLAAVDKDCECQRKLIAGELDSVISITDCEWLRNATTVLRVHTSIPLRMDHRTLGILNLAAVEGAVFDDAELQTLQNVGNQVAIALDRAHLHERLERLVEERTANLEQEVKKRIQAEQQVRESEERYRAMFDQNPYPMWLFDLDTLAFLAVNDAAVTQYGYSREEFLSMTIKDIRAPEEVPALLSALAAGVTTGVYRHRKKDGSSIDVEVATTSFHFAGRLARLVLAMDVTEERRVEEERRQLEGQLAQERRVESLGRVAATIAHEFNNVLMGILPFAEIVQRTAGKDQRLTVAADHIMKSVHRGKRIAQEILAFTKPVKLNARAVDFREVLSGLFQELRASLPESCGLDVLVPGVPVPVLADRSQIEQVITNLVLNARDAMEGSGVITLEIDHAAPDGFVHLSCSDTGSGIPPEFLDRIFEPLFTTKRSGTGIGLAVVHQVITRHGGRITVESRPGGGTTFHVLLPRAAGH